MIEHWAEALEGTALAAALRNSVWSYPLVNAAHILGVALLVGSIVPLDLRFLGVWPGVPLEPLRRVLTLTGAAGFVLAVVCGALLFTARAVDYVHSTLFIAKMIAVAAGAANVLALRLFPAAASPPAGRQPLRLRVAAAVSMLSWIAALALGRLVGYF